MVVYQIRTALVEKESRKAQSTGEILADNQFAASASFAFECERMGKRIAKHGENDKLLQIDMSIGTEDIHGFKRSKVLASVVMEFKSKHDEPSTTDQTG